MRKPPAMPALLARLVHPDRLAVLAQFLRFGAVGGVGFLMDTATVYATRGALGLYGAGLLAYLVAATGNWILNRLWTFRGQSSGPAHREWARFLGANALGFVLNRGAYFGLVTVSQLCADHPVIAVAAGSLTGMLANFNLSRRLVFTGSDVTGR
jgi:putative flippase GtrA